MFDSLDLRQPRQRRRLATFLSFLWPGGGELYTGRILVGALLAVPLVLAIAILAAVVLPGVGATVAAILDPTFIAAVVLVIGWSAVLRVVSMANVSRPLRSSVDRALLIGLSIVVIVSHAGLVGGTLAFRDSMGRIFVEPGEATATPRPAQPGRSPDDLFPDDVGPYPSAVTPASTRINVLVVGADSGTGYRHSLTDTMIVVSADSATGQVAMVSLPRDLARFELYDGRLWNEKLNALMTLSNGRPKEFPEGGLATLAKQVGFMLGIPIHYFAFVNLAGFRQVIDAVGGVDVDVARDIRDPFYDMGNGKRGFYLEAGLRHLDGRLATAYVRSRMGAGDNDFTRARRQQQLLLALRSRLTDPAMLPRLQSVIDAFADVVKTNYPADRIGELLSLSQKLGDPKTEQIVLGPPYATRPPSSQSGGVYYLVLSEQKVRELSIRLFGSDSVFASGGTD